jgi:SAM-dependent methyltransferase
VLGFGAIKERCAVHDVDTCAGVRDRRATVGNGRFRPREGGIRVIKPLIGLITVSQIDRRLVPTMARLVRDEDRLPSGLGDFNPEPPASGSTISIGVDGSSAGEQCHHRYIYPCIRALLPHRKTLSILDAGCGGGFIAAQLAAMGHQVVGIDSAPGEISAAKSMYPAVRFELASVYDDLTNLMPPGGWDLIVSAEVIEHLYSPRDFLRNVHKHLHRAGSLILSTPYHGYLKNLALSLLDQWDHHHGVDWDGGHIKFFSPKTLTVMLRETGFGEPAFRNAGRVPWLWRSIVCRCEIQSDGVR